MKNIQEFNSITEYKRYAKNLVAESLGSAFEALKPVVEQNSELYNSWIIYKGRHLDTQKFFNQHVFNKDEIDQERNKIRSSVLQLIDNLTESDFQNMIIEVQLNEKIARSQYKIEEFEEKVEKLTNENKLIQDEKIRIQNELEKQKQINDQKIYELHIENEKLKGVAQNYEQAKKQVEANEQLIDKLRTENKSLYESNKKLSDDEKILGENLETIETLKNEKYILLNEVDNLKKQEKILSTNKKSIENLKAENTELKHQIALVKTELKNANALAASIGYSPQNKKIAFGAFISVLILLIFSSIQFVSNQKLNNKLYLLTEEIEEYEHEEADKQITSAANINSNNFSKNIENEGFEGSTVDFKIINSIAYNGNMISNNREMKIERLYKIKEGEGVNSIINKFNMTVMDFKKINPKISDINHIKSGEFIKVYDDVRIRTYKVLPKETLGTIARKHKMWSYELLKLNKISNPDILKVGQEVFVFTSKYY